MLETDHAEHIHRNDHIHAGKSNRNIVSNRI